MQDLYATSFRVERGDLDEIYRSIRSSAVSWAWRGPGAPPNVADETSGARPDVNGYRMGWTEWSPSSRPERALEVTLRHPDPSVEGREWRTTIDVCRKPDCVGVTARVAREAVQLRMTPAALTTLRRPSLVPRLLNTYPCGAGSLDVTATAASVHVTGTEDFIESVLRNDGRALPVVVLTPPTGRPSDVDPGKLADELAGLAHVAVLGGHLAWARFRETIGDGLYAPRGGIRIYWPGFGRSGDELYHPYWTWRRIDEERTRFHRVLFALLTRISVHAVPLDPLPAELRRAAAEDRLHSLAAEGRSQADLLEMYDEENRGLRERVRELEETTRDQARELEAHRANWATIATAGAAESEADDEEREPLEPDVAAEPESWSEFIEYLPALEGEAFVVTTAAREMCDPSPYPDPARMWRHLEALAEAAEAWAAQDCSVGMDLGTWIHQNYGIEVALHDGSLGSRAEFVYEGERYSREPHVKVDDFVDPARCGRIYFAYDSEGARFIVDHIGLHL